MAMAREGHWIVNAPISQWRQKLIVKSLCYINCMLAIKIVKIIMLLSTCRVSQAGAISPPMNIPGTALIANICRHCLSIVIVLRRKLLQINTLYLDTSKITDHTGRIYRQLKVCLFVTHITGPIMINYSKGTMFEYCKTTIWSISMVLVAGKLYGKA